MTASLPPQWIPGGIIWLVLFVSYLEVEVGESHEGAQRVIGMAPLLS